MSSHSTNIQFKSVLHQVLKMTPSCSYTGGKSRTPLIYRFIYDVLSNAVPHTQQALTQLIDVIYAFIVDPQLHLLQPRSYNPRGLYLGCLGPLVRRNSLASLGVKVRLCYAFAERQAFKCRTVVHLTFQVSQGSAATDLM